MDSHTIKIESPVGHRLEQYKKQETIELTYQGKSYSITSKLTIGRDKSCDIFVDDKMTSRYHAEIQKIKDAYFIKDLDSTNGTFVNNERVPAQKYIKLYQNDIIKVGRTEIKIK
ncbi:MAG: FHA domain-containing protein [Spirochaetes bacterium]|nr:FHA domain-containing protein [Spirochaetota bacterium]